VELRATAHVATIGIPTILSMTWQDIYRVVPAVDGPVDFPGVIVATGRFPPTPPPPGVNYTAQVQARLTSPTGFGVPVTFDLNLDGVWKRRARWRITRATQVGLRRCWRTSELPVAAPRDEDRRARHWWWRWQVLRPGR
jgi:hypothetical protein